MIKGKKGQTIVEYVLLITLLSLVALGVNKMFTKALTVYFQNIAHHRTGIFGSQP